MRYDAGAGLPGRVPGAGAAVTPLGLLGTWELGRVVDDHLAGERRDVRGTATLALESPDRVRWSEEGTMSWPGHAVPVSRTLFVVRSGEGWFVEFEDGRPFHPWVVGERIEHPCSPDRYLGLITVGDEGWTVEWRATGPEKDYVMTTVHSRPA
jgi:hypothetical protein